MNSIDNFELNQTLPVGLEMSMIEHKESWESYDEDSSKRFNLWLIECAVADSPKKEISICIKEPIEDDDLVEQQSFESYKWSIQREFANEVNNLEFKWSNHFQIDPQLNSSLSMEQIQRIQMLKDQRRKEVEEDASFSVACDSLAIEEKKKSIISSFSNL